MSDFIAHLIEFIARIWFADEESRHQSPMTHGSDFDKQSRKFVAWLCGGAIVILVVIAFLWWWFTRKN